MKTMDLVNHMDQDKSNRMVKDMVEEVIRHCERDGCGPLFKFLLS